MNEHPLNLHNQDVAAIVASLRSTLGTRLRWCLLPNRGILKDISFDDFQTTTNGLVNAYTKMMLQANDFDFDKEFYDWFSFKPEIWKLIDTITEAKTWHDIPAHTENCMCNVCDSLIDTVF